MKSPFSLVASTRSKAQVVFSKVKMTAPDVMVKQSQAVRLRTRGSGGDSDGKGSGNGHQSRSGHRYPTASKDGYMRIQYFNQRPGLGSRSISVR